MFLAHSFCVSTTFGIKLTYYADDSYNYISV